MEHTIISQAGLVLLLGAIGHIGVFVCGKLARKGWFLRAVIVLLVILPLFSKQFLFTGQLIDMARTLPIGARAAITLGALLLLPWTISVVVYRTLTRIAAPYPLRKFVIPGIKFLFGMKLSDQDAEIIYAVAAPPEAATK